MHEGFDGNDTFLTNGKLICSLPGDGVSRIVDSIKSKDVPIYIDDAKAYLYMLLDNDINPILDIIDTVVGWN